MIFTRPLSTLKTLKNIKKKTSSHNHHSYDLDQTWTWIFLEFCILVPKATELKKEMEEARGRREVEHLELTSGEGLELVPLMKNLGRPLKDPTTG